MNYEPYAMTFDPLQILNSNFLPNKIAKMHTQLYRLYSTVTPHIKASILPLPTDKKLIIPALQADNKLIIQDLQAEMFIVV